MRRHRRSRRRQPVAAVLLAPLLAGLLAPSLVPSPAHAVAAPVSLQRDQLARLSVEQAWQHSTGAGVTVAVLDSGVDAGHPALAGRVLPGADYVDGSTDGHTDPVGHGTAVASLIAGAAGSDAGGLAPGATILPVRVLDEENRYRSSATVAQGVRWAVAQGAQVINLSLGGQRDSEALSAAISHAMAHDVVVVACTGNAQDDAPDRMWYPAREPGVVAVAGLEWTDGAAQHWPRSLAGRGTVLSAPAVLSAAAPDEGIRRMQGTSFSAALVSATVALLRAHRPHESAGEVVHRLLATAEDLGEPGRDEQYGFGLVDPAQALTADLPPVHANPLDTKARHGQAGLGAAPNHPAVAAGRPAAATTTIRAG